MRRLLAMMMLMAHTLLSSMPANAALIGETPSGIPFDKLGDEIDSYVEDHIGKSTPGAAVTVIKDGEIIFSKGYGYANLENKEQVDPAKTVFEYGSISKLFVWTAAMQLVEQGKLDSNEDIKTYLPENFTSKLKYEKPITMNDLMSHTAGFEDVHFDLIYSTKERVISLEEALLLHQPKQIYEPGSTIAYSNFSTSLAGYIVEQLSGQSFSEYEMEHIFKPSSMISSSGHPTLEDYTELEDQKAFGYMPTKEENFKLGTWSYVPLYPAGAVNGTAEDLARYAMALMPAENDESPLFNNRNTLNEMLTQSYTPHNEILSNAHGFWEYDGKMRGVGHGGNTVAFSSNMVIIPEEQFGVIVLTNAYGEMNLTMGLVDFLLGKPDNTLPVQTLELPSTKEVEGLYVGARQSTSSYTELLGYLMPLNVEAIGENELQVSIFGAKGTYIQKSPYFYEVTSNDNPIIFDNFRKVYVEMGDRGVKRITTGQIGDYLPLEGDRQFPWLIGSLVIVAVGLLYFTISPIVILIKWIKSRKNKYVLPRENIRERRLYWFSSLMGTTLILNNVLLIIRSALNPNGLIFDALKVHLILNWVLLIVAIVFIMVNIFNWKSVNLNKKQKFFRGFTFSLMILVFVVLANWNFLNISI